MAINKKLAKQFGDAIIDLQNELDFEEGYNTFQNKLFDLIRRGEIQGETLREFIRQINTVFEPELVNFTGKIYQDYNEVMQLTNSHYNEYGPEITRDLNRIKQIEKINLQRLGDYKNETVRAISKEVRKGILDGKSLDQIATSISSIDDKAKSFANTIARTQVKGYGQVSKIEKARLGEIFFYRYFGIIRETTRVFCRELLNQSNPTFHINDLKQMSNGQQLPVIPHAGGWRCHHYSEPDPFYDKQQYSISFYTKMDGKKQLKLARHN